MERSPLLRSVRWNTAHVPVVAVHGTSRWTGKKCCTALLQQPVASAQIRLEAAPAVEPRRFPGGVKRAADGLVFVQPVEPTHWERLLDRVGGLDGLGISSPLRLTELVANRDAVDAAVDSWVASRPAAAVISELQDDHVPAAPVYEPADVLTDEHLKTRGFFGLDGPTVPWIRTALETLPPPTDRATRSLATGVGLASRGVASPRSVVGVGRAVRHDAPGRPRRRGHQPRVAPAPEQPPRPAPIDHVPARLTPADGGAPISAGKPASA